MENQQPKRKSLLLHRLAMVAVALVCLAAIKMLLGTRTHDVPVCAGYRPHCGHRHPAG